MTARRRRNNESYEEYQHEIKREATADKLRLKSGKVVWSTVIPHPDKPGKVIKLPPFKRTEPKPKRVGAARRAKNRAQHEDLQ